MAGADAASLLTRTAETVYPVMINGETKSSVTIVHKEGGYAPSSFGNAEIVKNLTRYRNPGGSDFMVRVPALNLYFLGRQVDNHLVLVAVSEDARLKLRPGEPAPAETVLQQLVPLANAYNGLPL